MQYLVMLTIVMGLAADDIITGWIKAHIKEDYSSKVTAYRRVKLSSGWKPWYKFTGTAVT